MGGVENPIWVALKTPTIQGSVRQNHLLCGNLIRKWIQISTFMICKHLDKRLVKKNCFWQQTCSENIFSASFTLHHFAGNLHLFVHVQCDISTKLRPAYISVQKSYQTHGLAPWEHGVGTWVEFIPCSLFNWRWMELLFPADCFSKEFTCLRVAMKE